MPYWQLFYHVIWSTKNRLPLVTPEHESIIYEYLRLKAIGLDATVYALNGMPDHVHMVVAIPPKIAVATFIGQVKGIASTKFNQSGQAVTPLLWQDEYGVFSFDKKSLSNFVTYVKNQKQHHADNSIIPILERADASEFKNLREETMPYGSDYTQWHQAMMEAS